MIAHQAFMRSAIQMRRTSSKAAAARRRQLASLTPEQREIYARLDERLNPNWLHEEQEAAERDLLAELDAAGVIGAA